jgi:putative phosphoribosyl transferase
MNTAASPVTRSELIVPAGGDNLNADLAVPAEATGIVLFAHGSGSSRLSSRNRFVAGELNRVKLATVLADLLTADEEQIDLATRGFRFDISLLTGRLVHIIDWLQTDPETRRLPLGLFGASTGAAAALNAAAGRPALVRAIVSRGGRPDLATLLSEVQAPTLLIVGGNDTGVIGMNEQALRSLPAEKRLEIVPGATHLFEEPGKLAVVAELAGNWFLRHLGGTE